MKRTCSITCKEAATNSSLQSDADSDLDVDGGAFLVWQQQLGPSAPAIQSATFTINVTNTSVNTYEIYEGKRSWAESQATWKKANSGTNWQSAGAQGALDRGTTVLGTVTASATGVRTVALNAAGIALTSRHRRQNDHERRKRRLICVRLRKDR